MRELWSSTQGRYKWLSIVSGISFSELIKTSGGGGSKNEKKSIISKEGTYVQPQDMRDCKSIIVCSTNPHLFESSTTFQGFILGTRGTIYKLCTDNDIIRFLFYNGNSQKCRECLERERPVSSKTRREMLRV